MDSKLFSDLIPESDDYLIDIHTAASIGCDERVRDIIENLENKDIVNKQNKISWTPLMYAASCINLKVAVLLLEEGAFVDMKNDDGHTALILAAKCGSSDLINLLIDKGANVNDKDFRGWTAVFHAAAYGHRNVLQSLIEKGASLNVVDEFEQMTPLMLAASAGNEVIVRDLLYFGANVNIQSKYGDTARTLALQNGHTKIANLIDSFLLTKQQSSTGQSKYTDLFAFLKELNLTKYYPLFESHDISLNTLWLLTEENLKELGITLVGPRRRLYVAISQYNKRKSEKNCSCSLENKKLLQTIEELKSVIQNEQEIRAAAERNLSDNLVNCKKYVDAVQQTFNQFLFLLEKVKDKHSKMRSLLFSILPEAGASNGRVKPRVDQLLQVIDLVSMHIGEAQQQCIYMTGRYSQLSSAFQSDSGRVSLFK